MDAIEILVVGYRFSTRHRRTIVSSTILDTYVTDGGTIEMPSPDRRILNGLKEILLEHDIATVMLVFRRTDRGKFFGVLELYQEYGVEAKVLRDHVNNVLLPEETAEALVMIDSNYGTIRIRCSNGASTSRSQEPRCSFFHHYSL